MAKRRTTIIWATCLILVAAIGVLWAIGRIGPDPAAIKAELEARIEELNKIPAEEAIRKDALAEEHLANDLYKQYAKALWLKLERAHRSIHDAALLERAAAKEVPPFLARCKDLSKVERAELQMLIGEARSLLDNYGATRYADALRKTRLALDERFAALPPLVTAQDVIELTRKVQQALTEGHFSGAQDLIKDFQKRPGAPEYQAKVEIQQESLRQKAATAVIAVVVKANQMADRGDRPGAVELLERSLPDFKGLQKETDALDSQRRKFLTPR